LPQSEPEKTTAKASRGLKQKKKLFCATRGEEKKKGQDKPTMAGRPKSGPMHGPAFFLGKKGKRKTELQCSAEMVRKNQTRKD